MNKELKKSHVKKGDLVKVMTGQNKGTIGKITSIFFKNSTVSIEGIAPRTKFVRKTSKDEEPKVELPVSIHLSNVMLWDNQSKVASRIGYKISEGKKIRYFKKSGNIVQ